MNPFKKRFSARLSDEQLSHVKAQSKPSCYLRNLIERDIQAVNHDKA
jgi:hypothetical protein